MTKALVLHSGGIDSTTCLYMAAETYGEGEIEGVSINYGQRHSKEIDHAKEICGALGCGHLTLNITPPPPSMLTDPSKEVPDVSYDDITGVSPTYVPFRNGLLLSTIAGVASAKGAEAIYFGAHAEDAQNWAYPDCTPEFIGAMANAIYIGTYHKVRLVTPLEWLTKWEIIRAGTELKVPWKLTWSCYKGETLHCGVCPTCRSRRVGFKAAGISDPTVYAETPVEEEIPF